LGGRFDIATEIYTGGNMQLGLMLNGCGGDDRDYDDEHMMVHDDDGDGDGSATDDDDVLFFKVEPALYRCVLWLNLCAYSFSLCAESLSP
jgi:hypothetical protein